METELNQLLALLGGEHGKAAAVVAWIGAVRVPLKLVSSKLQAGMERAISRVLETEDDADDKFVARLLNWGPYKLTAFVVDLAFSLKLPLKLNGTAKKIPDSAS